MKRPVERVFEETLRDLEREELQYGSEPLFHPSVECGFISEYTSERTAWALTHPFFLLPHLIAIIAADLKETWYRILFGAPD